MSGEQQDSVQSNGVDKPQGNVVAEKDKQETLGVDPQQAYVDPMIDSDQQMLEHEWSLWFDNSKGKSNAESWGESLVRVHSFKTVEEFWALFNNTVNPSKLQVGSDIYLFKSNIKPTWEHPKNSQGGGWSAARPKSDSKDKLDEWWMNILMALIGEQFDDGDEVCGVALNIRKLDRLVLWTKSASNEAVQMAVGRQFKEFLQLKETIKYVAWQDKQNNVSLEKYAV